MCFRRFGINRRCVVCWCGFFSSFSRSCFGREVWAVGLVGGGKVPGSPSHLLLRCTPCDVVCRDVAIPPPPPSTQLEGSYSWGWFLCRFMGNWRGQVPAWLPWHSPVGSRVWCVASPASQGLLVRALSHNTLLLAHLWAKWGRPCVLWDLFLVGPDPRRCSCLLDLGGRHCGPTLSVHGTSNWPKERGGPEWSLLWCWMVRQKGSRRLQQGLPGEGFWPAEGGRRFPCAVAQVVG